MRARSTLLKRFEDEVEVAFLYLFDLGLDAFPTAELKPACNGGGPPGGPVRAAVSRGHAGRHDVPLYASATKIGFRLGVIG